jgi:MFS family permease
MGVYTSNSSKLGWLTSILELGAWVGTLYSGFLAEILSRKYAILINVAVFIIGVVVQTTAITNSGASSILGGRFITGKTKILDAFSLSEIRILISYRYGSRLPFHDCSHVQC